MHLEQASRGMTSLEQIFLPPCRWEHGCYIPKSCQVQRACSL